MALFEWKDEFSVGVSLMDQHHQKLISIVNTIHDAMKEGKGNERIGGALTDLLDYTNYHFREEERLMAEADYPELDEHKKTHLHFVSKLEEFREKAGDKDHSYFLSFDVSKFLIDWLINHIGKMDKRYQTAMNSKGIK